MKYYSTMSKVENVLFTEKWMQLEVIRKKFMSSFI